MNVYKGRMPTKIELTREQSQQGVSNDVLVSIEGVEELKRNVWIKGLKKVAVTPPKWVAAKYNVSGALLHRSIAQ
ncbi:hypothetical protein Tco_0416162, partial [Tanacetum coccineum]